MEDNIYKFTCCTEYEKYYSEDSFYGAYNVTVETDLPYAKEHNGFSFDGEKKSYFINLAGKMQRMYLGCKYEVEAKLEFNNKYNCWQYIPVGNVKAIKPNSVEESKKFLSSVIHESQAEALLDVYPNIVDMIINKEDVDLTNVKGIKDKSFAKIKDKVIDSYGMSDLLVMLQPLGITLKTIEKIKMLDNNIEIVKQKIEKNPYILTKIKGLGFKKVDGIAMKINPKIRVSKERTMAYLVYFFEDLGNKEGDTLCNIKNLNNAVSNNIPECYDIYEQIIENNKINSRLLYIEDNLVGLKRYRNNELAVFSILETINDYSEDLSQKINGEEILLQTEKRLGFSLTDEQRNAVLSTLTNGVTLITANAGAGKTTSVNGIIDLYKNNCKLTLCSLSAKAARRMTESTGYEAQTIHKTLGFGQSKDPNQVYLYNSENPLNCDVVIMDEASMTNTEMFLALLQAIRPTGKVIIVFDPEQLPPIGYGNIATDLLNSDFNICKLTKVHRQALNSGILVDANKIRQQVTPIEKPVLKEVHGELQDLCYMFRNKREQLREIIVKQYLKYIEEVGVENCVIIVPRKQDCVNSIREINKIIQDSLISNNVKSLNRGDTIFKVGARVIQKTNDSTKGVINGELGYIIAIYEQIIDDKKKNCFTVKFDTNDKEVEYEQGELGDLELGYALTVHSSQGSEYHTVIVGIDNSHYNLLSSNLLYTAITRAKSRCLLSSEPSAFQQCIRVKKNRRKTWLRYKFKKVKDKIY